MLIDKRHLNSNVAGNGLLKAIQADPLSVKPDTTTGGNVGNVVNVAANGVGVRIDNSSVKVNGSNQLYVVSGSGGLAGYTVYPMFMASNDYVTFSTLTYTSGMKLWMPGGTAPTAIKIVGRGVTVAKFFDVRLYDVTNALVIAEKLAIAYNANFYIIDLGTVSNWPAGAAIMEFQGRKEAGANPGNGEVSDLIFKWT